MTPASLVETLRARGVQLRAVGDRLRVRPAAAVTPEEVEALRQHKGEILALLRPSGCHGIVLDPATVREVLGANPTPHHVAMATFDVMQAVAQLEAEIRARAIGQTPLLVRGRPLADWLSLDDLARLLRAGKARP